ncbi:fimbrial protein [Aquamicrobium segne]|uniref:Fimbrial protein n=1 Tax=Aquamicrobium segne TaxID=469547 RepID=A0ABW0H2U4_9HYPH
MPRLEDEDENENEKPLDPSVENVRRKMVRFMGINLGILFFALMVVIAALVYKSWSTQSPVAAPAGDIQTPTGQPVEADIVLPVGARLISQSISGDRISLEAELTDGARVIFIYDLAGQKLIGRFSIRNK